VSGPKPKPTALKVIQGNPGKRRLPKNEPKPRRIAPDPAAYLDADAVKVWKELAPELEAVGVLTIVDRYAFAAYCQAVADIAGLSAFLAEHGETHNTGQHGAIQQRPQVAMLHKAYDRAAKFGAEFGIGAASRTKVEVKPREQEQDPLEAVRKVTSRRGTR
jgi:P27 family predicted phage terminase small subunit